MVVVRLMGGFGNQLFQYAAGRALALKRNEDLFLDLSFLKADPKGAYTKRRFELDQVRYIAQVACDNELKEFMLNSFFDRVLNKAGLKSHRVFYETGSNYTSDFEKLPKNVLLSGYWQNEKYFSAIRKQLLEDITPLFEFTAEGKKLSKKIVKENSVSIHVRRGDYVSLKHANDFHGTCGISYYQTAVKKLEEQFNDLEYFVFSDDINWCKEQFTFTDKITFVDDEPDKSSSQDLFLMSRCKHNIIANSSYSWWATWLNKNPGTVIAPKNWFRNDNEQAGDLIPARWIKL